MLALVKLVKGCLDEAAVKSLQTDLNKLGAQLDVDGDFGTLTDLALKSFQKANGLTADGWAGDVTLAKIKSRLAAPAATVPAPQGDTPWMDLNASYMGIKELLANGKVNPFITLCFMHTDYHTAYNEAWCAAYICRLLEECGFKSTHDAGADSFAHYGTACSLRYGCIVVIQHLTGSLKGHYHVTTCYDVGDGTYFIGRGGNQNNMVCDERFNFSEHKIVACVWPVKAA